MKELRINTWLIILGAVLIALLSAWLLLFIIGHADYMLQVFLNYSFITMPLLAVWWWMNLHGWHTRLMQWKHVRNALGLAPDLRGRWEGTIDRNGEGNPHRFVIEIRQQMDCMQIYSYSSRGKSESITHGFVCDAMGDDYLLCYHWQGKHGKRGCEVTLDNTFYGFSRCLYRDTPEGRFLEEEYFTNRQPEQTMGKVRLEFKGLQLKKHF
ncbi:hypothetical protein [Alistipes sp.]|uniref:hypothetical protein n=1 Tax=Alistipes sp. TaxID=1872444 RepID=UPI003AF0CE8B